MSHAHSNYSTNSRFQLIQYRQDLVVKFPARANPSKVNSIRGDITCFSRRAVRRLMFRLRNCACGWKALITLTYPEEYPMDGRTVKKHLHTFLQDFSRVKTRNYWALEFQERGAPHIHIIVDSWVDMIRQKRRWYEIVGSGDPDHLDQGLHIEGVKNDSQEERNRIVGYLYSYLNKVGQKLVPKGFENVGRFWGGTREVIAEVSRVWARCDENDMRRSMRVVRRWYEAKNREWQQKKRETAQSKGRPEPAFYKWRWVRRQGFTAWGGAAFWEQLFFTGTIPGLTRKTLINFKFGGA